MTAPFASQAALVARLTDSTPIGEPVPVLFTVTDDHDLIATRYLRTSSTPRQHVRTPIMNEAKQAHILANAIDINSARFAEGEIDHETWDAEQMRLWAMAARLGCAADVMKLITSSCGASA